MKTLIKNVLDDMSKGQVNLESPAAREMIANTIMAAIKSEGGWFLDLIRYRPSCPVLAVTWNEATARKLMLVRGVQVLIVPEKVMGVERMTHRAFQMAAEMGIARRGDRAVVLHGLSEVPKSGEANVMKPV